MKRILKISGLVLATILVVVAIILLYIGASDIPSYDVELPSYQVESSSEALVRGKKLAQMLCAGCHLDTKTRALTGQPMNDSPPEFGNIYAPNITQDATYGISDWSDAELLRLLRTGIKKNGQFAPPYMAKLPLMADEDVNAIIAFLKSDDPMVAANATPDQPCKPSFLTKMLCRVAFKPFAMPEQKIDLPDTNDVLALGEYLAHNLDCFSCHSADFKTNNYLDPTQSEGYFAGGNKTLNLQGEVVLTSNLTPHPETGIGGWSKDKFIQALKYGIKEGEPGLTYPMAPYVQLSDHEAGAIFEFLQTIPAIDNKIERQLGS